MAAALRTPKCTPGVESGVENLEIYRLAHDLGCRIHAMSLTLPSLERLEEASQIRRSSKRVSVCIVEGHTQRKYKGRFLSYLYHALGSSDETQEHLKYLHETGSLKDPALFKALEAEALELSRKLFRFIQAVERHHETPNYLAAAPNSDVDEQDSLDDSASPG